MRLAQPNRIDFHIFSVVAMGHFMFLFVTVVALGLIVVSFVVGEFLRGTVATLGHKLLVSAYQIPRITIDCLPTVSAAGAAFSYSFLSQRNELPILRAAGISAWRFLMPAAAHGLLVGGFVVVYLWQISSVADYLSVNLVDRITDRKLAHETTVWLHQKDGPQTVLVRGTKLTPFSDQLEGTSFFVFSEKDDGPVFDRRIDGRSASLADGQWQIDRTVTRESSGETLLADTVFLPTNLTPPVLHALGLGENQISIWEYPRYIKARQLAGLAVHGYLYKFNILLALPFFLAGMAMMGGLLCARMARSGQLAAMTLLAVGCGISSLFMSSICYALADRQLINPILAAWCPALFFLFLALAAVAFTEDG